MQMQEILELTLVGEGTFSKLFYFSRSRWRWVDISLCSIHHTLAHILLLYGEQKLVVLVDAASHDSLVDANLTKLLVGELVEVFP